MSMTLFLKGKGFLTENNLFINTAPFNFSNEKYIFKNNLMEFVSKSSA